MNDAQELTRLLTTLQSSIGTFTSAIDGARRHLDNVSSGFDKETKELEEQLKKMGKWNKAEDAERMEEIRQHHSHLQRLKKVEQDSRNQMEAAITRAKAHDDNLKALQAEHLKQTAIQHHKSNAVTAEQREAAKKNAEKIATQMRQALLERGRENKAIGELNARLGEAAEVQGKIVDRMNATKKDLAQFSWKDAGKQVGSKAGQAVWSGITSAFSGLTVGNALKGAYENLTDVMATGGDNMLASLDKQADIIKLGLTPDEYIKMNAASRQTILATGGVAEQMQALDKQSEALRGHFKTIGDATKFTQGQMDLMAKSGIRPTVANAGLLNESFKKMKAYTGMTGDAFLQLQQELSQDADIQSQLRSVNMQEREQILASNAARMAEQVALGMTTEQAKNVTKSLAKMANTGPLDRIKQAAKMRALGAAMGIDGSDDAANILLKGKRATEGEKKRLEEWHSKVSNKSSESQVGDFGGEILIDRLQKGLGNEFTAADSVFNTRLAEGNAAAKGSLDQQVAVNEKLSTIIGLMQQVGVAKSNPFIQGAGGVAGGVGSVVGGGLWETIKGGATGAAGGLAAGKVLGGGAATGGLARGAMGLARGLALPALAAGAGAYAIDAGAGALGVGKKEVDVAQDDANWDKASFTEKLQSAIPRGIEKAGSLLFLDNLANDARAKRISSETSYLQKTGRGTTVVPPTDSSSKGITADQLQDKLGDSPKSTTPVTPSLTAADTRADSTSPIGLQLSKMDESNVQLKALTALTTKQLEIAEQQLAATLVADKDKNALFKSLASGNKFMTNYSTPT